MRFYDRREAGRKLAWRLRELAGEQGLPDPIVLALPRGGVPVAAEVARVLDAPLDVLVVRKIGLPGHPETGIGAIVADEPPLFDPELLGYRHLSEESLAEDVARERIELRRRERLYRHDRPPPRVRGRTVLVIDDGLATGVTARAALRFVRTLEPGRLILAVPVCSPDIAVSMLRQREADDLVCLHQPRSLRAVSLWYEDFDQVSDEDVIEVLHGLGVR